jgi:deoxyribodipyrimidine photolyase
MKLFIHRKDLRTEDLPALDYIRALNRPILSILILDPFLFARGGPRSIAASTSFGKSEGCARLMSAAE